jgi:hypothetical protein
VLRTLLVVLLLLLVVLLLLMLLLLMLYKEVTWWGHGIWWRTFLLLPSFLQSVFAVRVTKESFVGTIQR